MVATGTPEPSATQLPCDHPATSGQLEKSNFLRACRGQDVSATPVWFMRQAGRSLPEYRALREGQSMLETCFNPELVAEITMQPVRRHGVDAAILFSDIVVPLKAIGIEVDIAAGVGPIISEPIRSRRDVDRLRDLERSDLEPILSAVAQLSSDLGPIPLIGFAGAPFTVASYLVEGRPSRDHVYTKALMLRDPQTWHRLLARLAKICGEFLRLQILAGASAVQLFDSWVGALPVAAYREFVAPHTAATFSSISDFDVPKIHFGVGTGELLSEMAEVGNTVQGVDYRLTLTEARRRIGRAMPLQGNLDPAALFAGWETLRRCTDQVLADGRGLVGHVFNLGHGVPPTTDPSMLTRLTEYVHQVSGQRDAQ